jgi:CrcB protein
MKRYVWIGLGGFLGAILKIAVKNNFLWHYSAFFPIHTLIVNIVGCFLIAWFLTLCTEVLNIHSDIRLCIATGFIGAFTTFSTFIYEGFHLFRENKEKNAVFYVVITLILGIMAYAAGYVIASA